MERKQVRASCEEDDDGNQLENCPILPEILARLPIKSLFTLKCVSRQFRSLISAPPFRRIYLSLNASPWTFLYMFGWVSKFKHPILREYRINHLLSDNYESPGLSILSFPDSIMHRHRESSFHYDILASSNGLLLCAGYSPTSFYVYSLLIKQWVSINVPSQTYQLPQPGFGGLVTHVDGGVEEVTSYRVVLLQSDHSREAIKIFTIHTFASETGQWRTVQVVCSESIKLITIHDGPVSCKGNLHWRAVGSEKHGRILAYDPYNKVDTCRLIELPLSVDPYTVLLGVCQGNLHFLESCKISGPVRWNLWVLKDYDTGLEWKLKQSIDCDEYPIPFYPIAFHPLDSPIIYFLFKEEIISYNIESRKFEKVYSNNNFCLVRVLPMVLPMWPLSIPQPHLL